MSQSITLYFLELVKKRKITIISRTRILSIFLLIKTGNNKALSFLALDSKKNRFRIRILDKNLNTININVEATKTINNNYSNMSSFQVLARAEQKYCNYIFNVIIINKSIRCY